QPADAFVSQLMGSDDLLRLLRLVRVTAVMHQPTATPPDFLLPATADLHTALSLLLPRPQATIGITAEREDAGQLVGILSLSDIQHLLQAEVA
ncbi:MAG: hypothetical protein KDD89_02710, partial [Anaerolineales bacterium]|nr:hypothetical protein [Anaerolineales bacterium]